MEVTLVSLLQVAWIAAILPILIACLPLNLPGIRWFHDIVLGFAKRGKIMQSSSSNKLTLPQRFFWHFYVLAVIWTTILLASTWLYAYMMTPLVYEPNFYSTITKHLTGGSRIWSMRKPRPTSEYIYSVWVSVFLLLLMEVQVLRRLCETIYVFKYSPSARMHVFGYLAGIFFYTAAPLSLCCNFAPEVFNFMENLVVEFIVKGKSRMTVPEYNLLGFVTPILRLKWHTWIGAAIFVWGWMHQRCCHEILGSLRDENGKIEEYVIPHGDWFEYVSSPHYLAEIVIYGGLMVGSGGADLTIWLLFCFVVANLSFAAAETQRWYRRKFKNYPRRRFAIIPFIY